VHQLSVGFGRSFKRLYKGLRWILLIMSDRVLLLGRLLLLVLGNVSWLIGINILREIGWQIGNVLTGGRRKV
jgi:hypothetical protein